MTNLSTHWSAIPREWVEAAKELARIVLISVFPVFLLGINTQTGEFSINWRIAAAVGLVALIKAVDKMIHTYGKDTNDERLIKGLTRF